MADNKVSIGPFLVDFTNQVLRRGKTTIELRPKTFAVLHHLVENAGRLVTKEDLLEAVWPNTAITDTVLKVCVGEIREAFGDDAGAPHYIETAHRRGYRFIAAPRQLGVTVRFGDAAASMLPRTAFVGRESERAELRRFVDTALAGAGQLVLVAGEAGVGKTRLCEEIAAEGAQKNLRILVGRCYEMEGVTPYIPFVEVLETALAQAPSPQAFREAR
jgi:DNA-binding winged helix-turn-helix (wHTH) protein